MKGYQAQTYSYEDQEYQIDFRCNYHDNSVSGAIYRVAADGTVERSGGIPVAGVLEIALGKIAEMQELVGWPEQFIARFDGTDSCGWIGMRKM